ncbi:MAG: glycosyltransferase [Methyloglobulus sp.]|nr:glycosyltransferase family 2 protein [Methyloglobulus sp.]
MKFLDFAQTIGAVVIGRNEGERLRACLESLTKDVTAVAYVDSGSTDGSVELAKEKGVLVLSLDMTQPFTAARARNAGFKTLLDNHPALKYVQFIDGDCQLVVGWLEAATGFLEQNPDYAVTCGRRRERFPEKTTYNQLCDMEWNTPVGEATACGGDALIRIHAFTQVVGYRDDLIAGEEPEMCFRLRSKGWKIYRLDAEMTWHDAAMTKFSQWWKRTLRSGYAFTAGRFLHGDSPEKFWVQEYRRILLWGLIIPCTIIALICLSPLFLGLALVYPVQVLRVAAHTQGNWQQRLNYGYFTVLGKFAELCGLLRYVYLKQKKLTPSIIEYK